MKKMESITVACRMAKSSTILRGLLVKILEVGNIMNEGSFAGGVHGFKLDSLQKLKFTKSTNKGNGNYDVTLLDFIIHKYIEEHYTGVRDERIRDVDVQLFEDNATFSSATKVKMSDLTSDVNVVRQNIEKCKLELERMQQEGGNRQHLSNFVVKAECVLHELLNKHKTAKHACTDLTSFFPSNSGQAEQILKLLDEFSSDVQLSVKKIQKQVLTNVLRKQRSTRKIKRSSSKSSPSIKLRGRKRKSMSPKGPLKQRDALLADIIARSPSRLNKAASNVSETSEC